MAGAHNPERAINFHTRPMHGLSIDRFVFRQNLGQFSRENGTTAEFINAFEV